MAKRRRHQKKQPKLTVRDFFSSTEEWDEFIASLKPGTYVFIQDGELVIKRGKKILGALRDV